jgi:HD-like signal output (HDOD) protein
MNRRETLNHIAQETQGRELNFPTSATVALRVSKELDNPDCSIDTLSRLIKAEPLLAARILAVANSAAFNRSGRATTDVKAALTLLGFRTIRALATAIVVRQLAGTPKNATHRALAIKLWEHSAYVSALAQLLARRVTHQDAETALFAGMVHEIGGFYLISRADEYPELLEGDPADWFGEDFVEDNDKLEADGTEAVSPERKIGRAVLNSLQVPAPVVAAVEILWNGYLAYPPASLGDTLLLADQLAPVSSPLERPKDIPTAETEPNIDLIIEQKTLKAILQDSEDEMRSLARALQT